MWKLPVLASNTWHQVWTSSKENQANYKMKGICKSTNWTIYSTLFRGSHCTPSQEICKKVGKIVRRHKAETVFEFQICIIFILPSTSSQTLSQSFDFIWALSKDTRRHINVLPTTTAPTETNKNMPISNNQIWIKTSKQSYSCCLPLMTYL